MSSTALDQELIEMTRAEEGDSISPCNENLMNKQTHCKCGQDQTLFTTEADNRLNCYNNEELRGIMGCKFYQAMTLHENNLSIGHEDDNATNGFKHAEVWMLSSGQSWQRVEEVHKIYSSMDFLKLAIWF